MPNIDRGTRDDGLLLRAGAGMGPADVRPGRWLAEQGLDEASMGKASRTKVDSSRREKIAAQRAAARRAEQRRRILIAGGSVLAVIVIIVAFIVFKANKSSTPTSTSTRSLTGSGPARALRAALFSARFRTGDGIQRRHRVYDGVL